MFNLNDLCMCVDVVVAPPIITKQPMSKSIRILENVTFTCKAVGFEVEYEWKRVGSNNVIGSESSLTISEVTPSDGGHYYCTAITEGGNITSDIVTLSVNRKFSKCDDYFKAYFLDIIVVMQSNNTAAAIGSNVTISITAEGHYLKYQWKKVHHNSLPSNVAGKHSAQLNITSLTHNNGGGYYCIIKDHWGHKVNSTIVILTVLGELSAHDLYTCYLCTY